MERVSPPTPKAQIGDHISILVDEQNGRYDVDIVTKVHLMASKAHGWRVGYETRHRADISIESVHFGELVRTSGTVWFKLPEPRYWIDELVSYHRYGDWTAGVISEVDMEFNGLKWVTQYWMRGLDEPTAETSIGRILERSFSPYFRVERLQ